MKPLEELTNTDKAKIIHQLFPEEIPLLLDNILHYCSDLKSRKRAYSRNWGKRNAITFDFYFSLSLDAERLIQRLRFKMIVSDHVFAEQLCFEYMEVFFNDCLVRYAKESSINEKFTLAVSLFYLP